jgi:DNA anti-recombination protein RmuC
MYEIFTALPLITRIIIIFIVVVTISLHLRYNNTDCHYGPIILTMLGIFGCFIGIAIGLYHFDTSHLEQSVPDLLEGIKTSFWASIAGIGAALTIKFRYLLFGAPTAGPTVQDATIGTLAALLHQIQESLAGEEDSTLLSQVKLMRHESRDGLTSLKSSLDNYMEKMAADNSKALIEALREVIRDFNAKISEQFGDNFRELNSAVGRLLAWQEAYRGQMVEMIEQQRTATESMSVAATRYSQLVQRAERFSAIAADLRTLLTGLETQREQLLAGLTHLGSFLQSAGAGIPRIEERMTEMIQQIEAGVRNSIDQIAAVTKATAQEVQTSQADMKRILTASAENIHKEVNSHVMKLSQQTRDQVVALDRALSEELTKSLDVLARHLTALSGKFVEDYTPLTDRLRELVHGLRV